jgi:His/Glu/Gln/Arg/opine family amino acid ABC transporter permease subunit
MNKGTSGINFHWALIWENRDLFWHGLMVAISVSFFALVLSVFIGMVLALARLSRQPFSFLAAAYINVFRGIPALVSVIWVYFGWSLLLGHNFTVFQAGVIALTLLYSAFLSEIFRAAIVAIPKGQRESGLALGLTNFRIFRSITLPQALKIALPNVGSMFIGMVKDTSTFTVIGLTEVVRVTQNVNSVTFQPFVLYTAAAMIYVVVAFVLDFIFRTFERVLATPTTGRMARAITHNRQQRLDTLITQYKRSVVAPATSAGDSDDEPTLRG